MAAPKRRWFRVADSIGREAWTNDELATVIRLLAELNTRRARDGLEETPEAACTLHLGASDVERITGKRRIDVALKCLERLADIAGISVERQARVVVIRWPKVAKTQDWMPSSPPPTGPSDPISEPISKPSETEAAEGDAGSARKPAALAVSDDAKNLTRAFADSLLVPFPEAKPPTSSAYAKWEVEMDRLLRIDGRTPEQVANLVRWLFDPSPRASPDAVFWRANVQSVPTLREKWDRLEACRARRPQGGKQQSLVDAAENVARRFSAFESQRGG